MTERLPVRIKDQAGLAEVPLAKAPNLKIVESDLGLCSKSQLQLALIVARLL